MTAWAERGLRIGGVEILLRTDRGALLEELTAGYRGYEPAGGPPDVVHEYRAIEGFRAEQPAARAYPGYGCVAEGPLGYRFARADSRGRVDLPADAGAPVVGAFEGRDAVQMLDATLRLSLSLAVPRLGGLLVHSAALLARGEDALVFAGPSGAGKSTLFRLLSASGQELLGDEMTLCRPVGATWRAFATPFGGECGTAPDGSGRLRGVYFLRQAPGHAVTPLPGAEALPRLLRNAMAYVAEREAAARALAASAELVGAVGCHVLDFSKDPGVAGVLGLS